MTITTVVVLMAALAEPESGTVRPPAAAQRAAARETLLSPAGVTCTMRVVRLSPTFDAGILAPRARVYGDAAAVPDAEPLTISELERVIEMYIHRHDGGQCR